MRPNVESENAYAILGVGQCATLEEIRKAYRKLLAKYHPDAVAPDQREHAARLAKRVEQAYELLSHPEKRFQYDHWLEHTFSTGELLHSFEETYEVVKDEDKHPLYEFYDALYPRPKQAKEDRTAQEQSQGAAAASLGGEQNAGPVDVEVPASVRDAVIEPRPEHRAPAQPALDAGISVEPQPRHFALCRRCGYSAAGAASQPFLFCPQCGSLLEQRSGPE